MAGLQKILLVEDNLELRKMYETFLELNGLKVAVATDGDEGLKVAQDFKPDLIFLDIMMPKKDGFEVLKILRHNPDYNCTRAKIVMLTNLGDTKVTPEQRQDMDGYVVKADIMLSDILEVIKSLESSSPRPATS